MQPADLDAVERLGNGIHVDHPESPEIFAERLALCPEGCFVLEGLAGYVLSHPWMLGAPPALNTLLGALPSAPDTWYIHDVALAPSARGTGSGAVIVARLTSLVASLGMTTMSLIAVGRSPGFWSRQGFAPALLPPQKLVSYGEGATHMVRPVRPAAD